MVIDLKNGSRSSFCQEEKIHMGNESSRTRLSSRTTKVTGRLSEFQWECPFCKGIGIDPFNKTGIRHCPACHGHIFWESDIRSQDLERCDNCDGSGKINIRGDWKVCPQCDGAGRK